MTALSRDITGLGQSTSGLLAFSDDGELLEKVGRAVPGTREGIDLHLGGLETAIALVSEGASAEVLLIDVTGQTHIPEKVAPLIETLGPQSSIILVGGENDIALYRQLITIGVTDYLLGSELSVQQLRRSVLTAGRSAPEPQAAEDVVTARIAIVIGARGGIGTTSVSTSLAWTIANQHDQQVGLIDLDLQFGTAALSLDIDPGTGLREALEHSDRIDSLFVASAMVLSGRNLNVLSAEESPTRPLNMAPEAVTRLLDAVKPDLDQIILELPRHMIGPGLPALEAADDIILVTDLSLSGLRDVSRIRAALVECLGDSKIRMVANRVGLNDDARLSVTEFEKSVNAKFDAVLDEDQKAGKAALEGKPIGSATAKAKTVRAISDLAKTISGQSDVPKKKGFLDRLKGLRNA